MADARLTDLSAVSVLELDDAFYVVDVSDTTDNPAGSSRLVLANRALGLLNPGICQGRLTLETAVPVSTTDQTAKSTLYFTPCNGNRVALYDGTRWRLYALSEVSLALTLTSGKNYDVFLYDNAGTLTLELGSAWTNDTTRADALTTQDGIHAKTGATTRRYVGTIRASGTDTTEDSQANRFVWTMYEQCQRNAYIVDSGTHTYDTAVEREWNNGTTVRANFVVGLARNAASAIVSARFYSVATNDNGYIKMHVNGSTLASIGQGSVEGSITAFGISGAIPYSFIPRAGLNFVTIYEWDQGNVTNFAEGTTTVLFRG